MTLGGWGGGGGGEEGGEGYDAKENLIVCKFFYMQSCIKDHNDHNSLKSDMSHVPCYNVTKIL